MTHVSASVEHVKEHPKPPFERVAYVIGGGSGNYPYKLRHLGPVKEGDLVPTVNTNTNIG